VFVVTRILDEARRLQNEDEELGRPEAEALWEMAWDEDEGTCISEENESTLWFCLVRSSVSVLGVCHWVSPRTPVRCRTRLVSHATTPLFGVWDVVRRLTPPRHRGVQDTMKFTPEARELLEGNLGERPPPSPGLGMGGICTCEAGFCGRPCTCGVGGGGDAQVLNCFRGFLQTLGCR